MKTRRATSKNSTSSNFMKIFSYYKWHPIELKKLMAEFSRGQYCPKIFSWSYFHFLQKYFTSKFVMKVLKSSLCNGWYDIFLRNFYARCSPQIKDTFFLFAKVQKINSKSLKRKNAFIFLNLTHFLKKLREHYAQ